MSELIGRYHEYLISITIDWNMWLVHTPKQMKANKVKSAPVAIVNEVPSIDSMFQTSSLGYLIAPSSRMIDASKITIEDGIGYIVTKLEAGQSANRQAILFAAWIFKTKTIEEGKAFSEKLKARWSGSTIDNLLSIARALPALEKIGLDLNEVNDVYGLREVSKLIKDEKTSAQAIKLLNAGESPRKVKTTLAPKKVEEKKTEEKVEESESLENKAAIQAAIMLTAVERFALLADHESRLKIARQMISKLSLGNFILASTDAHQAIQTLKAKK